MRDDECRCVKYHLHACLGMLSKKKVKLGTLSQHGLGGQFSRPNNFGIYLGFEGLGVGKFPNSLLKITSIWFKFWVTFAWKGLIFFYILRFCKNV